MDNRHKHILILIVLMVAAFWGCLSLGFVNFDDPSHLIDNPATKKLDLGHLGQVFTQHVQRVYIPLTTLFFSIERHFFGLNPFIYHLDNLLLHVANSVVVYYLALRLNLGALAAFFAAAVFGLHPMRVESVAWVTERKDVLCALFYFLALYQWVVYRGGNSKKSLVLVYVFTALSLLAKPMAISLPLALLCIDYYLDGKLSWQRLKEKFLFFVLGGGIGTITYQWHVRNPIDDPFKALEMWIISLGFYWQKFFVPLNLNPIYPLAQGAAFHAQFILSLVLIAVIVSVLRRARSNRLLSFSVFFYIATIFFLLRLDQRSDIHWVADRFMYIPSLGLCLLLGVFFGRYKKVGFAVLVLLGILSFKQVPIWKDSLSLWSHVIQLSPQERLAYNNRANTYMDLNQPQKAVEDYTKAIDLMGRFPSMNIISRMASADGRETVTIKPWHLNVTELKFNRALSFREAKRYDEALSDLNEVTAQYPQYDKAYYQRGLVYEAKGLRQEALVDYGQCVAFNPNNSECYAARGNVYNKLSDWFSALADYNRALKISPQYVQVYNNRAIVYLALKIEDKALADLNSAIEADRNYGESFYNRSVLYYSQGKYKQALLDVLEASRLGILIPDKYYQLLVAAKAGLPQDK